MAATEGAPTATDNFRAARDLLLKHRTDHEQAVADFAWPHLEHFNFGVDWFDVLAAEQPETLALWIVQPDGTEDLLTYADLSARSSQLASWLRAEGVDRGDRLLLVLDGVAPLWEVVLACIKLGVVVVPANTRLGQGDLADRIDRADVRHVVTASDETSRLSGVPGDWTRIAVGPPVAGWLRYDDSYEHLDTFEAEVPTRADETLLLYFTGGTTARPKVVEHTHVSYPVGHLSTMYWIGLQPGDVHLDVSEPGSGKHTWTNVFAAWSAGATAFVVNEERYDAATLLDTMGRCGVTTLCAPPTVWRMLAQEDLTAHPLPALREVVATGAPLHPEVVERVQQLWGRTVRDGYGQTETTAMVGNPPGAPLKPGSMGRALPGYSIALLDPVTSEAGTGGEICIDLSSRPTALMTGYRDDQKVTDEVMRGGYYHTGDLARLDEDGYLSYVARNDEA